MLVLTQSAGVTCGHGGMLIVAPGPGLVTIEGQPVMTLQALMSATFTPCALPPPPTGLGPCLKLLPPLTASTLLTIEGQPAYLNNLAGVSDHAGVVSVSSAGQALVTAQA